MVRKFAFAFSAAGFALALAIGAARADEQMGPEGGPLSACSWRVDDARDVARGNEIIGSQFIEIAGADAKKVIDTFNAVAHAHLPEGADLLLVQKKEERVKIAVAVHGCVDGVLELPVTTFNHLIRASIGQDS